MRVVKLQVSMTKVAPHCKNKLVVLTRVVALVADKLERQWLLEFALMLKTNCIRQPQSYFPVHLTTTIHALNSLITAVLPSPGYNFSLLQFEVHL